MAVPSYDELFNPLLQALRELGDSASIPELESAVAAILGLSEEEISLIHRGNRTKFSYNLAWSRTYLKWYGVLENSERGVWSFTEIGSEILKVDVNEVKRFVKESKSKRLPETHADFEDETLEDTDEFEWQDQVLEAVKQMPPAAFERLCQRLLRESGFIQVEVTGKSGDGGIDGKGIVKLGGVLSFHVIFQCKRYGGSVSASAIRDFRGATMGRADKGLFLTTGKFTRDARKEAQRDGAPPIDLIDGDDLIAMLKEKRLGIEVKQIVLEEISVNTEWFQKI
jgi:restriction system protein